MGHRHAVPRGIVVALLAACLCGTTPAKKPTKPTKAAGKSAVVATPPRETFESIIRNYAFVADFNLKDPARIVSDELFWRYPWKIPDPEFPMFPDFTDLAQEFPPSKGGGRAVQHINRGRALFLEGNIDEARNNWLSARARYGKDWPFHRRNDYFIGYAFYRKAFADMAARKVSWDDKQIEGSFSNATTFMSWAFLVKKDEADPVVDYVMPKGLYNLASIYFRFKRYSAAYGAATSGLDFLRKTGRKEYRPWFRRFIAESMIQNRSYLEAIQEFDTALRQDPDAEQAAGIFMRVGDLYFDLNNYELAEEAYRLSGIIDEELRSITPAQMIIRGESLFWLGKFDDAQRMFHHALDGVAFRKTRSPVTTEFASWAKLRFADAFLAQKNFERARLAYFQVSHEYRGTEAARIAQVRRACLELPFYEGNNVRHARELLEGTKELAELPDEARELSWACHTSSFAERERTQEMVERVRSFATKYPESRFLRSLAEPVREVQAERIEPMFDVGDQHRAISFFEKNRKILFPKIDQKLGERLFIAYTNVMRPDKAAEFWGFHEKMADSDLKLLREAAVATEMLDDPKTAKSTLWKKRFDAAAKSMTGRKWSSDPVGRPVDYFVRLLNSRRGESTLLNPLLGLAVHWSGGGAAQSAIASGKGSATDDSAIANLCRFEFPVIARLSQTKGERRAKVTEALDSMIARGFPRLLATDEGCAASILDLEARVYGKDPAAMAARWRTRRSWTLTTPVLTNIWSLSETLYDRGDKKSAEDLWRHVRDNGPAGAVETGLAKARLDPSRTEFENLWN